MAPSGGSRCSSWWGMPSESTCWDCGCRRSCVTSPDSSNLGVGILSAVPNLIAAVAMVLVGSHSDRTGERPLHLAAAAAVAAVGLCLSASLGSTAIVMLGLSLAAAGLLSMHGPFWPLPSTFLSGSAAAAGIALITSIANLGGFVGPYAMGLLKGHTGSFRSGLLLLALLSLVGAALAVRLRRDPRISA